MSLKQRFTHNKLHLRGERVATPKISQAPFGKGGCRLGEENGSQEDGVGWLSPEEFKDSPCHSSDEK